MTEDINDTIPSYRIDGLLERYNVALVKITKLTMKENEVVTKLLDIK